MPRRYRRTHSLALRSAELAIAVPQVVAHRVARMALAGANPSTRDRQEFTRMVAEKQQAFAASWTAMALEALAMQQRFTVAWWQACWMPWLGARGLPTPARLQDAMVGMLGKGLAPVHRAAVANARRLTR